jgi:transcriptional regulator with XRE-family HTH domain
VFIILDMTLQTKIETLVKRGMTLVKIAKATGYSPVMISYVKNGQRGSRPSAAMTEAIDRLLKKTAKK